MIHRGCLSHYVTLCYESLGVDHRYQIITNILKIIEIGLKSEIEAIVNYARSYVEPNPIKFEDILGILKNDLAITPEIINAILPEPIADRYFPDGNIPTGNLSEAAILAFVSLGGTVINPPNQIFNVPGFQVEKHQKSNLSNLNQTKI